MDTIFALSSGAPPAGIAVVRISGPAAAETLRVLSGALPYPRRVRLAALHDEAGALLDQALTLWFPGPRTATGEDLAELHLHGGRAVVAAVERTLASRPGLRRAEPGEFTRRAFANGRIDLAQAEGLADLLEAETELQRQVAVQSAGGAMSRLVETWRERLLRLSAQLEAVLDFEDEADVGDLDPEYRHQLATLAGELSDVLAQPVAETLREGFRVALAGPPNAGKSSLFNALVDSDAAIVSHSAGTTRDVLERPVALKGVPFMFVDMAGVHAKAADAVEAIGIERARGEVQRADLVLWLGREGEGPAGAWEIEPKIDLVQRIIKCAPRHRVSAVSGAGVGDLREDLVTYAAAALPQPRKLAVNRRQRDLLADAERALTAAYGQPDPLIAAELLRATRSAFDRLVGRTSTEDVLDTLFGRFCIGK